MPLFTVESGDFCGDAEASCPGDAFREALKLNPIPERFGEVMSCECMDRQLFKKTFVWTPHVLNDLGIKFEHGPRKHELRILPCEALERGGKHELSNRSL